MEDIKLMLKKRIIEMYTFTSWCIISPIILIIVLILMNINPDIPVVNGKPLPSWAVSIGWLIFSSVLIPIPGFAIYEYYKGYRQRLALKVKNTVFNLKINLTKIYFVAK
jgi:hypothetical protein